MIGSIKGKIILKSDKFIVVETNTGVGYKVSLTTETLSKIELNKEFIFWTHTHVREDILDLYGFLTTEELDFFELLITVSGIGPKGALGILSIAPIETLEKAISSSDISYLTKISGIGKKTAEKIVLELKDKIKNRDNAGGTSSLQGEIDALEALKSLGYSQNEAREALKKVSPLLDINTKIREALKTLSTK